MIITSIPFRGFLDFLNQSQRVSFARRWQGDGKEMGVGTQCSGPLPPASPDHVMGVGVGQGFSPEEDVPGGGSTWG